MNGVEAMHEVDGLRTAKRIVRKQTAVVKGERGEFARGYRRAINDLIAVIGAEIDDLMAEEAEGTPLNRPDLLKPGQGVSVFLADMAHGFPSLHPMSGAEFLRLCQQDRKNIDELAKARLKTDEELLAEVPLLKPMSDEDRRNILESLRDRDFNRARRQVMEDTGRWGPHGPNPVATIGAILAEMAKMEEMALQVRQKLTQRG